MKSVALMKPILQPQNNTLTRSTDSLGKVIVSSSSKRPPTIKIMKASFAQPETEYSDVGKVNSKQLVLKIPAHKLKK